MNTGIGAVYTPSTIASRLVAETLALWRAGQPAQGVEELDGLRVFDPACGEGALLLAAQRAIVEVRVGLGQGAQAAAESTLSRNLFGVDVDLEAVGVARALLGGGNLHQADALLDEGAWPVGGCDVIVANPPYATIQRIRRGNPGFAQALVGARAPQGEPRFESAQGSNFDLYLLFIERALGGLRSGGVMGFLAPSSWLVNAHGQALRRIVRRGGHLARWVGFGGHQIFGDAVTYSALQLFTRAPGEAVAFIPEGSDEGSGWESAERIPIAELPAEGPWHFLPGPSRGLVSRLGRTCPSLAEVCAGIVVGVQTSADKVFQLRRVPGSADRFVHTGRGRSGVGRFEVDIEPELMRPLVCGRDVHGYARPDPVKHLLLPYEGGSEPRLLSPATLALRYPKAWAYLKRFEGALRARERGRFDHEGWYRFGRHQNMGRQHLPKLLVPRLVRKLRAAPDPEGEFYLDNVDVGAVLPASPGDLGFLLAVLNSPVAHFFWSRTSRPFQNGYHAANKQFITPLPVPEPPPDLRAAIQSAAVALCGLHNTPDTPAERVCAATEALDDLVAEAYGLSAAERRLVAGASPD